MHGTNVKKEIAFFLSLSFLQLRTVVRGTGFCSVNFIKKKKSVTSNQSVDRVLPFEIK
jgi:hypothetical protein